MAKHEHIFKIESMKLNGERETADIDGIVFYCTGCKIKLACENPKLGRPKEIYNFQPFTEMEFATGKSKEEMMMERLTS